MVTGNPVAGFVADVDRAGSRSASRSPSCSAGRRPPRRCWTGRPRAPPAEGVLATHARGSLGRRVEAGDAPLGVDGEDAVGDAVEHGLEPRRCDSSPSVSARRSSRFLVSHGHTSEEQQKRYSIRTNDSIFAPSLARRHDPENSGNTVSIRSKQAGFHRSLEARRRVGTERAY